MIYDVPTDRLAETLRELGQYWEEKRRTAAQRPAAVRQPFTIALERETGVPGTTIGREAGARLGWPVYDHELLESIAQQMGVRTSLLESIDERHSNWLLERMQTFLQVPAVSHNAYVRHLVETMLALATHGECIIIGRGAPHVLPPANTLRVRLIAPLKDRIDMLSRQLQLDHRTAAQRVEAMDQERCRFIKEHFHRDAADPHHYDLLLNAARFSTAECAEAIVATLHRLEAPTRKPTDSPELQTSARGL
jgi:cytidylate kinase